MLTLFLATSSMTQAQAQTIPGSASADRIEAPPLERFKIEPAPSTLDEALGSNIRYSQPPANAESIYLKLSNITVTGSTVYSEDEIRTIYKDDLGKNITLARIWAISDEITKKYRQDGYFLSRAFVPAQEIEDGTITIRVAEGYIKQVDIQGERPKSSVVDQILHQITSTRPISSKDLEHYHLLLTDLAGLQNLYGTLAPLENQRDGGVHLIYARNQTATSAGMLSVNNYGSKFLGPMQANAQWQGNLIGVQQTSISARTSLPFDELLAANAAQSIPLTPESELILSAGVTQAEPGFTLSPQEIESKSVDLGIKYNHKIIWQRMQKWSANIALDGRNSRSTILGSTELSEDRVRALRVGTIYDTYDPLNGFNRISVTGSRGLKFLGSSDENDLNISRDGAKPDFSKIELDYVRYQALPYDLGAYINIRGQKASGSLYSSEEFGFGGQGMGRAYDSSEITGDDGFALSIEMQYNAVPAYYNSTIQPYAFYDIGKVWNRNSGQTESVSASSAGAGVRIDHTSGINLALEFAFPLTKEIDNPIYDNNQASPRLGFQVGYRF